MTDRQFNPSKRERFTLSRVDGAGPTGRCGGRESPRRRDCPASGVSRASASAPGGRRHAPARRRARTAGDGGLPRDALIEIRTSGAGWESKLPGPARRRPPRQRLLPSKLRCEGDRLELADSRPSPRTASDPKQPHARPGSGRSDLYRRSYTSGLIILHKADAHTPVLDKLYSPLRRSEVPPVARGVRGWDNYLIPYGRRRSNSFLTTW